MPKVAPVKFLTALTYNDEEILQFSMNELEKLHGDIDLKSTSFEFNYTKYYEKEMGPGLKKQFVGFKSLDAPEKLIDRKHMARNLEEKFSKKSRRQINIDPSYLELAKLVVASTKNFAHRIYLGQGIYGDLQLRYSQNEFVLCEWTYPDYKFESSIEFFKEARATYFEQLRNA